MKISDCRAFTLFETVHSLFQVFRYKQIAGKGARNWGMARRIASDGKQANLCDFFRWASFLIIKEDFSRFTMIKYRLSNAFYNKIQ